MFEKIFNALFLKTEKKSGITVISAKREITALDGAVKSSVGKSVGGDAFWESRGKIYGAIFTSLNGRTF